MIIKLIYLVFFRGGSTHRYITEVARGEEVQIMRDYIKSDDGQKNLVASYKEGLEKVRSEK